MRNAFLGSILAYVFLVVTDGHCPAQEWTRFRGPNGQGQSEATSIPTEWTASDFNWNVQLPGLGHGSPVVWENRIFLLSADPDNATRHVLCIDSEDGQTIWKKSFSSQPYKMHKRNSFASSTPAVDQQHVYVSWATFDETILMALDHAGAVIWKIDLGPYISQNGFGTSPILIDDLVIVSNMQQESNEESEHVGESFLVGVDRTNGVIRWKEPRRTGHAAYAVPCTRVAEDGSVELICSSHANGIAAHDPKSGRERWSIRPFEKRTIGSPILAGGLVFCSQGSGQGGMRMVGVRPGTDPEIVYEIDKQAPYVPTPVAYDDFLFLWSDKGIVSCFHAPDGKLFWRQRIGGNFSGSPVRIQNRLYCIDENGVVVVLSASQQFQLLARNPLGEPSRATPAVSNGRMYLRTYSRLFSIGG